MRERPTYILVTRLFLKVLGCIYLIAFVSFGVQASGLIGSNGILPVGDFLRALHENYGRSAYWYAPTLFWLSSEDLFLQCVWIAGAAFALLLIFGVVRRFALALLLILYLSLCSAGQDFMSFQWDVLLLEAGFLAIFLDPSPIRVWLFRWLLFRLVFMSGAIKLLSHDPAWRNLTALGYHYETQPLPTPVAWYMHQLPAAFQKASTALVFLVEVLVPFLIFAPRRLRFFATGAIVTLQVLILLTGNYTFFNLLTIALCLLLLDDAGLGRAGQAGPGACSTWHRTVTTILAGSILLVSGFQLLEMFSGEAPGPARAILSLIAPLRIVNTYGLFAVMTTTRPEIIVEGSNDGVNWLAYEFKYKPGDLQRPPPWVEPHQPRLDWQMWFAALGSYPQNRWFASFMLRLLQGSPAVIRLLKRDPFPAAPPRYIRALLYEYHFTDFAARRSRGAWWRRELKGTYFPPVSLKKTEPSARVY